jgi:uncharacterized membrane protein
MLHSLKRIAQISFSIALIVSAIIGLVHEDFVIVNPPDILTNPKWLFITGDVLLMAGAIAVIIKKFEFAGSLVCACSIFLFAYLLKVIPEFAKSSFLDIINSADGWEILAFVGSCLILANSFKRNKILFSAGLITISAFFLWAGIGHYQFRKYVTSLIPGYIPFHAFWVYFCGVCLILSSIGLWIPKFKAITAKLSAIMIFLWCIMLHIPNYFLDTPDVTLLMGILESLSFAAILVIVMFEFRQRSVDCFQG